MSAEPTALPAFATTPCPACPRPCADLPAVVSTWQGVGLSLEDALQFWEREFTKIMSTDVFNKQYAYNIRHNYGKEGKRKDYTPYNCQKIIMGAPPAAGDRHGCPFRHYDDGHLSRSARFLIES
jgi:DNA primase large subunit